MLGWVVLVVSWCAWAYPFIFRAPHNQNRPSITADRPDACRTVPGVSGHLPGVRLPPAPATDARGVAHRRGGRLGIAAAILSWTAVRHLGRQFRVNAGLYEDHELVTSGPYAIVRHPIYTSLLAMLVCSLLLLTPLAMGGALPRALRRRNGDSRPHRGQPAGLAIWRAFLRVPEARSGLRAICAIVSFI